MASYDSIAVTGDWISQHYLTSAGKDSFSKEVTARAKEWKEAEDQDKASTRSRFTKARTQLLADLALTDESGVGQDERYNRYVDTLLEILGFTKGRGISVTERGSLLLVSAYGSPASIAIIIANPADSVEDATTRDGKTLPIPTTLPSLGDAGTDTDTHTETKKISKSDIFGNAARLTSALFHDDPEIDFVLIVAGRWLVVADRERWAEGRHLAVNVQTVAERNDLKRGGETETALTILGAESFIPDAEGTAWWSRRLEDSVKHSVGVSKDLRDGVRESIEILASEVVERRKAKGLDPLPQEQAQVLARQALRYLYRILFLLYAEASPELEVLPVGTPEYEQGYSLDRLRDLVQTELTTGEQQSGTHLYDSLNVLFRLVDKGFTPEEEGGIAFNSLKADLFLPGAISLISEVGLGNQALQDVLARLLLSKEARGKDRGFISYAELGINQLGAVYEGLMSYTGFFADTTLYEVARKGDPSKGSWVVPEDRIEGISSTDFVMTENPVTGALEPVVHEPGSFVFRLAGRERQQSASYYTPEVLTRFTVSQALEELITPDMSAEEILQLSVCEPALGSGAFAIEATRQLSQRYLDKRQDELGEKIDPDQFALELQRTKAYIALHNVYGVDLNPTAVELAEISLWLDTMVAGLDAPWFGLHLRAGNSLIGARSATYKLHTLAKKGWLKVPADPLPLQDPWVSSIGDSIYHFLLPGSGWGAGANSKTAKELVPDRAKDVRDWSRQVKGQPTRAQVTKLQDLSHRIERLWGLATTRLQIAESQSRRDIPVWGHEETATVQSVSREQIEQALQDPNGAYQRLRLIMDAWCALWFWPLTDQELSFNGYIATPPTFQTWLNTLIDLVGSGGKRKDWEDTFLTSNPTWDELTTSEQTDLALAGAKPVAEVLEQHPWLQVTKRVSETQRFFHWELDFAPVFAEQGGFDLQVGNPPWVRPTYDEDALLAESDPWWQLQDKASESKRKAVRARTLERQGAAVLLLEGATDVDGQKAFLGSATEFPHLAGLQPDTYRCFMEETWRHESPGGLVSLIHPESHFTDEKAGILRAATYERLRRHWQFINEKQLFAEIDHHVSYGIHVYGTPQPAPSFLNAVSLYIPETVERSFSHDGSGEEPGLKDTEGNWDTRPHKDRITTVDTGALDLWAAVTGAGVPAQTPMVYTVNRSLAGVLRKIAQAPRVGDEQFRFSSGFHEKSDRAKGLFAGGWGAPSSWEDVILQGPHMHVGNPAYKYPNPTMRHNLDWHPVDLEAMAADAVPVTAYKPLADKETYDAAYTDWGTPGKPDPARDHYRVFWRRMVGTTAERSLMPALFPPGAAHVHPVTSAGASSQSHLVSAAGQSSSLLLDLQIRSAGKADIHGRNFARLPLVLDHPLTPHLHLRTLRLNCLTDAYADLWEEVWEPSFATDEWAGGRPRASRLPLGQVEPSWSAATPLRIAEDRRQALVEIDAIAAVMLGVAADELATVYRTAFPVLYGYDKNRDYYDLNGRLVPGDVVKAWQKSGDATPVEELTATNASGNTYVYEPPFTTLDREADLREAHAYFTSLLSSLEEADE